MRNINERNYKPFPKLVLGMREFFMDYKQSPLANYRRLLLLLFYFVIFDLYAGNTGKIAGTVQDADTHEPLTGVNVIIEGLPTGAATDLNGHYFIINLSPGKYSVTASMIGYVTQTKTNVQVNADRTTQVSFTLSSAILTGEAIVVEAEKEVVRMDVSSASNIVEAEEIAYTPYQGGFDQLLMSQPGWGDYRTRAAQNYSPLRFGVLEGREEDEGFQVRGGADWEVNIMVDGMSLKDQASGYQFTKINLANIQEVQLFSGGFNAEYGDARSGIINVITKDGGDDYLFSLDFRVSPPGRKHFGPAINDTTASVYTSEYCLYGPLLGFGDYYDPELDKYVSFEGTDYTGNRYFEGWLHRTRTHTPAEWKPLLAGDHHSGTPTFEDTLLVASFLREEWVWQHRPELWNYGDKWDYNLEATLGGPIPLIKSLIGPTNFFASYRSKYNEWMFPRAGGLNGGYTDYTAQLKLTNEPVLGIKIQYNALFSVQWGGYEYRGGYRGEDFPFGRVLETPLQEFTQLGRGDFAEGWNEDTNGLWMKPTYKRSHFINSLKLTWALSPFTFIDASVHYTYHWTDLLPAEVRDTEVIPDEPFVDDNNNGIWDYGEPFTDSDGDGTWTVGKYAKRIGIPGYYRYYDERPKGRLPDMSSLPGNVRHLNWQDESYTKSWTIRSDVTSQIGPYNQLKAGIQVIKTHEHVFRIKPKDGGMVWYFDAKPLRLSTYVQDKLELGGIIANIGVRIDGFDAGNSYYDFNGDPFNPLWGRGGPGNPLYQSHQDSIDRIAYYDGGNLKPGGIPDSLLFNPEWQVTWSPRIGISHPVSENGKIFFNYGHFHQPPRSIYLFALHQRYEEGWKLREAGNPRLRMERTVAWEVGYEHNIMNIFRIALTGYYRRIDNEISRCRYYSDGAVELYSTRNDSYRDVRGFEGKFEKRVGKFISGWISYDFELHSKGQGGYFAEYQYGNNNDLDDEDYLAYVPYDTNPVRRKPASSAQNIFPPRSRIRFNIGLHTPIGYGIKFNGISPFGGWRANFVFQWTEGVKFTYNPQALPYVEQNMQWKGYRQTDLKVSKSINFLMVDAILYLEIYNLFNTRNFNMINYFGNPSEDGTPNPTPQKIYYDSIIENGYQAGDTDKPGIILPWGPEYALFFPKRDIYFGIRFNFHFGK
jgi:hypothetical protein